MGKPLLPGPSMDKALALAIENGAELQSTDADFGRFTHLSWVNPLR